MSSNSESAPADEPPASTTSASTERTLLEPYARFRGHPLRALHELSRHLLGEGWRGYDHIVGQEVFYPGFSERMKDMVLAQPRLRDRIAQLARRRAGVEVAEGRRGESTRVPRTAELETQLAAVAEEWTDAMICKMESRRFIRGAYYVATQFLTRAYHQGISVSADEVQHLRAVAETAATRKQSIIFLPCHRSHVDYVSLQLICFRLGLALPTVVAGDNLNFPLVGAFLQHAGAMWIRRSFGDDALYSALVQAYMDTLLQNGFNLECFVEGGRSRTGKLLQPKLGMLGFFLESVMSGVVEDAIICPVSTQYDKVVEVDSYVSELLGQPKAKEDLVGFLSASNVLSLRLGRVDVRFRRPWSLREFVDAERTKLPRASTDLHIASEREQRLALARLLGYRVLSEINAVSVVMPPALVGTVLLTLRGRGVGRSELIRRVDWLSELVRSRGGSVAHFGPHPTASVVDRALEVLGPALVGKVDGLPEDTFYAVDRFQLSFHRNMTIHLFVSEALVCCALYARIKLGGPLPEQSMPYPELLDYVYFLSQLFRAEFIYPVTPLQETLRATLVRLERDRVLACDRSPTPDDPAAISSVSLHLDERLSGRENYDFFCFLLWPFVEASWLGTVSLFMLTPPGAGAPSPRWIDLAAFQARAQWFGKTLYHQGDLSYFEAVNKDALRNSFERSEQAGVVRIRRAPGRRPAIRLEPAFVPRRDGADGALLPEGPLWDLCEHVSRGRREGKNRRDGATVRWRVLGLAQRVGSALWEGADGGGVGVGELADVEESAEETGRRTRRRRGFRTTARPKARL